VLMRQLKFVVLVLNSDQIYVVDGVPLLGT
jgi:hypothetical protein